MVCAWSGTVGDLKLLVQTDPHAETIAAGFDAAYHRVVPSEARSWEHYLPALMQALDSPDFDCLQALVELQMPVGAERAGSLGGRAGRSTCRES